MDLMQIARNCAHDFQASHDGQMPTDNDMYVMLQQSTGVDVSREAAAEYRNAALEIEWCEGCQCEHGPATCHWR